MKPHNVGESETTQSLTGCWPTTSAAAAVGVAVVPAAPLEVSSSAVSVMTQANRHA